MQKQDRLWESENEDIHVMKELYDAIVGEAKRKGFNGHVITYEYNGELIAEVFESYEQYEMACNGEINDLPLVGHCKPLINELERLMNV